MHLIAVNYCNAPSILEIRFQTVNIKITAIPGININVPFANITGNRINIRITSVCHLYRDRTETFSLKISEMTGCM